MSPMPLKWLHPSIIRFPPVENALRDPNGLLALGGDITPDWLLEAYRHGIFPWYEENQPILWWSPDPRMVLYPGRMHLSRSMGKLLRRNPYRITFDNDFAEVIEGCADLAVRPNTWITRRMKEAFNTLHWMGYAHSVEVWQGEQLVGGLYGMALGRVFFGESMFSRQPNASKLALWHLQERLAAWDYALIDCQVASDHLHSLGAEEIPRRRFQECLRQAENTARPQPGRWAV